MCEFVNTREDLVRVLTFGEYLIVMTKVKSHKGGTQHRDEKNADLTPEEE